MKIRTCGYLFSFVCFLATSDVPAAICQIRSGWEFKDELISCMESPKDTIYVQDRRKLRRVRHRHCVPNGVSFVDSSVSLSIQIWDKPFDSVHHSISWSANDTDGWGGWIDGKQAYGIDLYDSTTGVSGIREIARMNIVWAGVKLKIPRKAIHNLYAAWLCDSLADQVEAYVTPDRKLLYIYVAGSDASGSYAVKFIFDRKGYITRIVTDAEDFASFDFLDALSDSLP
ncbi:MAG: hypothetical protein Q8916_09170 [Bacteroidota bacterium]|nr:hypothetical protein [Bacteroidota bacterium]MDP4236686.1 hypothetical protein [Bacteroidota bacterium]